jgi:hypothetical protein
VFLRARSSIGNRLTAGEAMQLPARRSHQNVIQAAEDGGSALGAGRGAFPKESLAFEAGLDRVYSSAISPLDERQPELRERDRASAISEGGSDGRRCDE